jgi:multidrug efflux pump subunit AcrA (membrane-fusion protein)
LTPLTKTFVVLLVILSLLQTAAIIVYVNKEDVQANALKQTQAQKMASDEAARQAETNLQAAQANLTATQQQANDQARAGAAALTQLQQQVADLNVQLARANSTGAAQQLDIARLTEALNASQGTNAKLTDEVARLRTSNDTLVRQASDLNTTVSDLTNKLDVTERERKLLAEQVAQARGSVEQLNATIRGLGFSPEVVKNAPNRGAPPINGVVKDRRNIGGIEYATISVGSADQVTQGMEFKVVNRQTGDFLGTLTVDTVQPNESVGRLAGPKVAEIRPGVEVRTQL